MSYQGAERNSDHRGFSLVEVMIVIALMFMVATMTIFRIQGALPGIRASAAMNQVMATVRAGRELAISQRRNIQLIFVGNNQIQLQRVNRPLGAGTTLLKQMIFENDAVFIIMPGVNDTPDGFGNASALDFGGSPTLMWMSDGTFVDANGQPLNGTIYFGLRGQVATQRAVTVLGSTGRIRGYKWTGSAWVE